MNPADDANIAALEDEIKRAQDAALGFTAQAELLAQVLNGDLPAPPYALRDHRCRDTQPRQQAMLLWTSLKRRRYYTSYLLETQHAVVVHIHALCPCPTCCPWLAISVVCLLTQPGPIECRYA